MSLWTLWTAFVPVAVLFVLAGMLAGRWGGGGQGSGVEASARETGPGRGRAGGPEPGPRAPGPAGWGTLARAVWLPATAEALVLTLLAALWFGSLGHGGWLTVFLLLGALVAGADRWTRHRLAATPSGHDLRWFAVGLLKYVAAGLVCAWRLS